ncbi:MAG: hypothetical protein GX660_04675 [Clostridiaceae bacterium]|nr:hypothetical protein [Clostridiaceae bacterium]
MDPFVVVLILDVLLLIVIMAIVFAYHKQENSYRQQLLDKMDTIIQLLQKQ